MGGFINRFMRRMGEDLKDTLEGIGTHVVRAEGGGGGHAPVEAAGVTNAIQVPQEQLANLDVIPQQLQNITAAVHLLLEGYLQLNDKYERGQRENSITLKFVKTVMETIRTETYDTPRLACLLVPWNFSLPQGLSPEEQDPKTWIRRLVDGGAKKTRGWFRQSVQLFFVCARTYRLVPCGPEGHGYTIQQFRRWMKSTFGVMKMMVELTSIVLGASVASELSSYFLDAVEGSLAVAEGDDMSTLKTYLRGSSGSSAAVVRRVSMQYEGTRF